MKRMVWLVLLCTLPAPVWAANKKVTAQELKDMLTQMQQQKKSDDEIANALKQVDVTDQLTAEMLNSLGPLLPGQQSLAQVYILEARTAMLPPPAAEVPTDPAPDAAAQKALLDKAADYVSKTYGQLPDVTATKETLRFQDSMDTVASSSGMHSSASEVDTGFGLSNSPQYFRFINTADVAIESHNGVEKMPSAKDSTPWGRNGYIALQEQGPVLQTAFNEAQAAGKVAFVRWELVNGKKTAVFSFAVDKKKSHYSVNFCCFPDTDQTGTARFSGANGAGQPGGSQGASGGAKGNFQTNTTWKPYKTNTGYHGEIFINAETGIVVRLINQAEFKSSEVIHQEDTRIDFGPVTIGDKPLVLPVKEFVNTEVVPAGEDAAGKYSVRHTLFYTEFKNYQLASAAH
jgi:hypothetical protein